MSTEDEIRQVSGQFYAALNQLVKGDPSAIAAVWSHGDTVTTMHPLEGRQVGWEQVRSVWEQAAAAFSDGRVTVEDEVVVPLTSEVAYQVGTERGGGTVAGEPVEFAQRVTNIYRREAGTWKIVHHHTDFVPAMAEIVVRAMAQSGQAR